MKIDPPLSNLINRCQTICVAECCGIDAYDFSPIQIASYLTMQRGLPDITEVETLRTQIQNLKANYGSSGASSTGVVIDEMNQQFSGQQIDSLASELLLNIDVALYLIEESEAKRYRFAKVDGLSAFLGSEKSAANKSREHLT